MKVNIPQFVRSQFKTVSGARRFTSIEVTRAARAAGMYPKRGVVGTALYRMAAKGELIVTNAPRGAWWTGKQHRVFVFANVFAQ